jgi:ligand-binding sensor protein
MTRLVIVREWMLIISILLGAVGIIAAGLAYHMEMLEDDAEDRNIAVLMQDAQTNREMLNALITKPAARPLAFDACAGAAVVEAMRANGAEISKMEFEQRCQQARQKAAQEMKP